MSEGINIEKVDADNKEQMAKLQNAWNWASNDLAKTIVDKEKELEVELFFPLLMIAADALKLRGLPIEEIKASIAERLALELETDEVEDEEKST